MIAAVRSDPLSSRVAVVLVWVLFVEFAVAAAVNLWKVVTVKDALRPLRAFKLCGSAALTAVYAASIAGGFDPVMSVIVARSIGIATTPVVWMLSSMLEVPPFIVPVDVVPVDVIAQRMRDAVDRVLAGADERAKR